MSWINMVDSKEDTLKFYIDIFIRMVSKMEGQKGDTWTMLMVRDWRLGGKGHS